MSSHMVGGLSHLWDDRTAPKDVAKGTTQEAHHGFGHDHGYYCVNKLADSIRLVSRDRPVPQETVSAPHWPQMTVPQMIPS